MGDTAFNPEFVTAVNARGEKQDIPRAWLDHPTLGAGFRLPASATPSLSWNREQLDAHATGVGLDPSAYATKADVLAAITTQTPDPAQGSDNTPPAGDEDAPTSS